MGRALMVGNKNEKAVSVLIVKTSHVRLRNSEFILWDMWIIEGLWIEWGNKSEQSQGVQRDHIGLNHVWKIKEVLYFNLVKCLLKVWSTQRRCNKSIIPSERIWPILTQPLFSIWNHKVERDFWREWWN